MAQTTFDRDVGVIGGCGRVGLPLALMLADKGQRVVIYDINASAVDGVRRGTMPFQEEHADAMLERVLAAGRLEVTTDPGPLGACRHLILIIGTPVDEFLNPDFAAIPRALDGCRAALRDGQVLTLRSTVFPGTTAKVRRWLEQQGLRIAVTFCPERVAQGRSIEEFAQLPQIVSAFEPEGLEAVRALFGLMTSDVVEMEPMEAEFAKLLTNAWRYIQFAVANQFFEMAQSHGLDFHRIAEGTRFKYPRLASMPGPGFAAGPCLHKDTMQLAAFSQNRFFLGHAAMLVNEGLPDYLVQDAKRAVTLDDKTVGILGMAFKAESDDIRSSLSYKLKKILRMEARRVLCSDPFVRDPDLVPLTQVLEEADVVFVGAPHAAYRRLALPRGTVLIDVWRCVEREDLP